MQHEWAAQRFYVYEIEMDKLILKTNSVELTFCLLTQTCRNMICDIDGSGCNVDCCVVLNCLCFSVAPKPV